MKKGVWVSQLTGAALSLNLNATFHSEANRGHCRLHWGLATTFRKLWKNTLHLLSFVKTLNNGPAKVGKYSVEGAGGHNECVLTDASTKFASGKGPALHQEPRELSELALRLECIFHPTSSFLGMPLSTEDLVLLLSSKSIQLCRAQSNYCL